MNRLVSFSIFLLVTLVIPSAMATNGYFVYGYGTKNKGLSGAGVALPQDTITAATNPAGMVHLGKRLDAGLALFTPKREYESSTSLANGAGGAFTVGPNDIESDRKSFLVPHIGYNHPLGSRSSLGITSFANGGMNTVWHGGTASFDPDGPGLGMTGTFPGTYGAGTAGVDLAQNFLALTYSRKVNERFSYGVGPVFGLQYVRVKGLSAFAGYTEDFVRSAGTVLPDDLTDKGRELSFGYGVKGGILWSPVSYLTLGGSYQSRIYMSEFDDYASLLAEDGDFDVPPTMTLGLALRPDSDWTFVFDFQKIWYSKIDSLANPLSNLFDCPALGGTDPESCLGGDNGAGFGWDDMEVYKLGVQYSVSPNLELRAGASFTEHPIQHSEVLFNILAPATSEEHYTLGLTRKLHGERELNFSVMYSPRGRQRGQSPFDPTQAVEVEMSQFELEASYSRRF